MIKMVKLKSTFGKFSKSGLSKKKRKASGNLLKGGVTALLGVALFSETASALGRI